MAFSEKSKNGRDSHLLSVRNLKTYFFTENGVVKAVDGVNFYIDEGEILGLVGESGCGKSVTGLSIMQLIPSPPGHVVGGELLFEGRDLLRLSETEMKRIRGDQISMIFQDPMTSLNPVHRIGKQIGEMFIFHRPQMKKKERRDQVIKLLNEVGIPSPEKRSHDYPHQLSGGMRQRAMIAMALACWNTKLLIADEPTTALDVTIQAQILDLLRRLQKEIGMSVILITHDLGVIAETVNRVVVMYAGSVVEEADVVSLFSEPLHPYTQGLLSSLPKRGRMARKSVLYTIPGVVPNPLELRPGCKFFNRCSYGIEEVCLGGEPDLAEVDPGHWVRCSRVDEINK